MSNSLKVQHSQSSPNRCCQSIANTSNSSNSQKSISSTLTDGGCSSNSQLSKEVLIQTRTSLHNGYGSSSSDCKETPTKTEPNRMNGSAANTLCKCKCTPNDFKSVASSSQELRKETCKILNNVTELNLSPSAMSNTNTAENHKNCKCSCVNTNNNMSQPKSTLFNNNSNNEDIDDWSLMLIGLAQIHPASKLVQMDPFESLPTISVVPPTPEGLLHKFHAPSQSLCDDTKLNLDNGKKTRADFFKDKERSPENSPDDSPQDEEPPYRTLNTSLKR